VLRASGPDALSLRAVARSLGVTEAAPYHHFRDRRALLGELAARGFTALHAAFRAHAELPPLPRLLAFAESYVAFALAQPGAYRAMFGAHVVDLDLPALPEVYGPGHAARELMLAACADVVAAERLATTREQLFATVWSLGHGVAWLHVQHEFPDCVPDDRAAIALVRRGVAACIEGLR
jgi:AcrR family transcriptional regulator